MAKIRWNFVMTETGLDEHTIEVSEQEVQSLVGARDLRTDAEARRLVA